MTRRLRQLAVAVLVALAVVGTFSPSANAEGYAIKVRVQNQTTNAQGKSIKEPVAGVKIQVVDAGGTLVVEGTTDDSGTALLAVPAKADYTVKLDESTLPEGFTLTDGAPDRSVTADRFISDTISVNYFTGKATRASVGWWSQFAQRLTDGARLGLVLAMCAVGLSLIFGTTGLTNFAHGEMVTFGALIAYLFNLTWRKSAFTLHGNFFLAAGVAVLLGGLFGLSLDAGLFAPLRKRKIGLVSQMVITVGLSIFLKNLFLNRFGGRQKPYAAFNTQSCSKYGPVCITDRDLSTAVISLVVLVLFALALQRTRLGKATRAVSDNPDLASSTGIDSQKIIRIVWFLGGALAALGGVFRGLDEGVAPFMGGDLLFLLFAGITLGGLGSAFGALVGSFIIGLFVEVSTLGIPWAPGKGAPHPLNWLHDGVPTELKNVLPLVIMIVVLLVRPQGILGRRERVG